jgi:hypothetical protein
MVGTKLFFFFFWHITGTSKFVLIPQGVNCKSGKPQGLILYFSLFLNLMLYTSFYH